ATIVAALRQASALQDKVRFQGLCFAEIEVELGLPPTIKLSFTEEEAASAVAPPPAPAAPAVPPPPVPPVPARPRAPAPPLPPAPARAAAPARAPAPSIAEAAPQVRFHCACCGKRLRAPEHAAGRKGRCRRCGAGVVVPAASGRTAPRRERRRQAC